MKFDSEMIPEHAITAIRELVAAGGPEPHQYPVLHEWFRDMMHRHRLGEITAQDISLLWEVFGDAFSPNTMQGFVVRKPHGYHGDYEIIDRIYTKWISPDPNLAKWDHFFHSCAAPEAVRNRKAFLHAVLHGMQAEEPNRTLQILSVGCGPARDIAEFLSSGVDGTFHFTCLDQDPNAIDHACMLCRHWPGHVTFLMVDVVRRLPEQSYDLVWAGGLFDYFPDRVFALMLRRLMKRVRQGGRLIVRNFSPRNSSRDYMEFGGWQLIHRAPEELLSLAARVGIRESSCRIKAEPQRVNLFLEVHK